MKIRIKDNSIRLRLSPEEVQQLADKGIVEKQCHFPQQTLSYGVQSKAGIEHPYAQFKEECILVFVSSAFAKAWPDNETVGVYHTTKEGLSLVIEKDFQCLTPREGEQEEKLYPNPEAQ